MTLGFVYWLIMLIWLVLAVAFHFGFAAGFGIIGLGFLVFVLFAIVGWQVFWFTAAPELIMILEEFKAAADHYAATHDQPPPIIVVYLGPSWIITGEWEPLSNQHILVVHIGGASPPVYVPLNSIMAVAFK